MHLVLHNFARSILFYDGYGEFFTQSVSCDETLVIEDFWLQALLDCPTNIDFKLSHLQDHLSLAWVAWRPTKCTFETYLRLLSLYGTTKAPQTQAEKAQFYDSEIFSEHRSIGMFDSSRWPLYIHPQDDGFHSRREICRRMKALASNSTVRSIISQLDPPPMPVIASMVEHIPKHDFHESLLVIILATGHISVDPLNPLMRSLIQAAVLSRDLISLLILLNYFRKAISPLLNCLQELNAMRCFQRSFFCIGRLRANKDGCIHANGSELLSRVGAQCLWIIMSVFDHPSCQYLLDAILDRALEIYGDHVLVDEEAFCRKHKLSMQERVDLANELLRMIHKDWPGCCPCSKFELDSTILYFESHWTWATWDGSGMWEPPRWLYRRTVETRKAEVGSNETEDMSVFSACDAIRKSNLDYPAFLDMLFGEDGRLSDHDAQDEGEPIRYDRKNSITDGDECKETGGHLVGTRCGGASKFMSRIGVAESWYQGSSSTLWILVSFGVKGLVVAMAGLYMWQNHLRALFVE